MYPFLEKNISSFPQKRPLIPVHSGATVKCEGLFGCFYSKRCGNVLKRIEKLSASSASIEGVHTSIATSEVRNSVSNIRPLILQKGQKCFPVHSSLFDAVMLLMAMILDMK